MGTVISFNNTPQAVDDLFTSSQTDLTENILKIVYLDVMADDLGGNAKTLFRAALKDYEEMRKSMKADTESAPDTAITAPR